MHSSFIDNILAADLDDMQLISNLIKEFFLCVILIFSKYARVVPLKEENCITIT